MNKKTGTFYVSEKNRVNTTEKIKVRKFDKKENEGKGGHGTFEEVKIK
jgi:ribosomal protein L33